MLSVGPQELAALGVLDEGLVLAARAKASAMGTPIRSTPSATPQTAANAPKVSVMAVQEKRLSELVVLTSPR